MTKKCLFTLINNLEGSILRKDFESFKGKFATRSINLNKVTNKIVDLQERLEYTPYIGIFQLRSLGDNLFYVFDERIYTINEFLDEFEKFLRANVISVGADNFEDVPKEYKHFFVTPYTRVPVDMVRTKVSISYTSEDYKEITHDQFKGVDFNSSCILKLLEPEKLHDRLEQIERAGNFSVIIKKSKVGKGLKVISFEYKTVEHIVFRS